MNSGGGDEKMSLNCICMYIDHYFCFKFGLFEASSCSAPAADRMDSRAATVWITAPPKVSGWKFEKSLLFLLLLHLLLLL